MANTDKRQAEFDALMTRLSSHIPAEQQTVLQEVFTKAPEAALLLGEEVMAKSDYTRNIQQVMADRTTLEAERAALTDLSNKVQQYDQYLQTAYVPREDFDRLSAERAQLMGQIEQISTSYPSLVEELGLPSTATTATTTATQNGATMPFNTNNGGGQPAPGQTQQTQSHQQQVANPIRNVTEMQWTQDKQQLAALSILSPAAQHDLAVRHKQVFGTDLPNMTELVQESANTGRPLEQIWAEKHNVAARMQELENQRIEQTVQERVEAELSKRISQAVVGGNTGLLPSNSPFVQRMTPGQSPADAATAGAPSLERIANQGTGAGSAALQATQKYLAGAYKNEKFDMLSTS